MSKKSKSDVEQALKDELEQVSGGNTPLVPVSESVVLRDGGMVRIGILHPNSPSPIVADDTAVPLTRLP